MTDTVLLVDDDPPLRHVVAHGLRREGFAVIEAQDGDQAIELMDTGKSFDVLVTDVQMPGAADGIAVAAHARHAQPELPIIIVSGDTGGRALPEVGRLDAFLSKPFRIADLAAMIRKLLGAFVSFGRKAGS